MELHKKQKGAIGEYKVMTDLLEQGYDVFNACGDFSKVDLIVIKDDIPYKIQVKSMISKNDKLLVRGHSSGPGYSYVYTDKDIDLFAVYALDRNLILYVPISAVVGVNSLSLSLQSEYASAPIYDYQNYLNFEECIQSIIKNEVFHRPSKYQHSVAAKKIMQERNKKNARQLSQDMINARRADYEADDKSYGMQMRLARKWNVSHAQVSRFIRKYLQN